MKKSEAKSTGRRGSPKNELHSHATDLFPLIFTNVLQYYTYELYSIMVLNILSERVLELKWINYKYCDQNRRHDLKMQLTLIVL